MGYRSAKAQRARLWTIAIASDAQQRRDAEHHYRRILKARELNEAALQRGADRELQDAIARMQRQRKTGHLFALPEGIPPEHVQLYKNLRKKVGRIEAVRMVIDYQHRKITKP